MAPPPIKRQRRVVVSNLDDDDCGNPKRQRRENSATASITIRSRRKHASKPLEEAPPSPQPIARKSTQSISAFFPAVIAGEGQKQASRAPLTGKPMNDVEQPSAEQADLEDIIEEVSDAEGSDETGATQNAGRRNFDRRKQIGNSFHGIGNSAKQGRLPNGSSKFKLPSNTNRNGDNAVRAKDMDQRPWTEMFPPMNLEELAVHKRKVSDVRGWLENVLSGRDRKRLLILKGPAGAGKTTTLKTLAQAMNLDLFEWKNSVGSEYSSEGYVSMSASFEDFLRRSSKFRRLELDGISDHTYPILSSDTEKQKLILLDEFPSTFISASTALQSFRSTILQYLVASTPSLGPFSAMDLSLRTSITPVIMIITETRPTSTTTSSDTFTVHRLLGSDILSHPVVSIIEFNPVAPTFVRKALDLVIQKEASQSGRRRVPGPLVLTRLGEVGDVRSAIGSLEFLCIRALDDWGGRVTAIAKKASNTTTAMTDMEKNVLEIVTQRENSLGLFHAVGKVVYNKREDFPHVAAGDPTKEALVQPPDHLREHSRLRLPQTSVDKLIDETGTDPETFIAALHENYVMSCEGSNPLEVLNKCLDALSDGDILGLPRDGRNGAMNSTLYGAVSESLRRDEIAFQLVVRGLLFALPDPVKRSSHPTGMPGKRGSKGDSHKMFYPASMRLSRQREEMEYSFDQWHRRFKMGMASYVKPVSEGSRLFQPDRPNRRHYDSTSQALHTGHNNSEHEDEPFRSSLNCTSAELILERLPYIAKIERTKPSSAHLRELEKITQFHGIDLPGDGAAEDGDLDDDSMSTPGSKTLPAPEQARSEMGQEAFEGVMPVEEVAEKLYLSDDDIED